MNADIASRYSDLAAESTSGTDAETFAETSAETTGESDDHLLAADLAKRAGDLLVDLRAEAMPSEAPSAEALPPEALTELKAEGDRRSHEFLVAKLQAARPHDIVLSEEGKNDSRRLSSARVWILDPLDGTREFGEPPRDDWAVHVALLKGDRLAAGAVSLPARGMTLSTAEPPALLPVSPPTSPNNSGIPKGPRVIASRSRPGPVPQAIADALEGKLIFLGSAGAKAMSVVLGDADIYAHTGGQYEWDSAAPVAVAKAAGCHTSRIDGSPLRYNQPDPYLPDLLICRPEWADIALAIASEAGV